MVEADLCGTLVWVRTRQPGPHTQVCPYTDTPIALEATSISTSKITERTHGDIGAESDSIFACENVGENQRLGGIPTWNDQ